MACAPLTLAVFLCEAFAVAHSANHVRKQMNFLLTQVFGSSMQWYWQSKTSVQLLDPMTTLLRVALLKYMPPGTLMRFHHNRIVYDGPGLLQGLQRDYARWCGQSASKEDLHNLLPPLLRACEWFGTDDTHRAMFQCAIDGLNELMRTYRRKGAFQTCDAIRSYVRLLQDTLDGRHLVQREFQDLMEASVSEPNVRIVCPPPAAAARGRMGRLHAPCEGDDDALPSPEELRELASSPYVESDHKPVIDLSQFWTPRQVSIVALLLEEVGERAAHRTSYRSVLESLESLLNDKETRLVQKIEHACTAV